jgi:ubiquinone/menaquinone biosynthesis C-methylase UbiE
MGRRRARAARVVLWGLAAGHVLRAAHLRRRRAALAELPVLPAPGARPATGGAGVGADDLVVLAAPGVDVDGPTRAAVAAEMEATGAQAVDLLPADLPAEAALRALDRVDPDRLLTDPMYTPGGANEALVLHPDLARRMGITAGATLDRGALIRRTVEAQRYAPDAAVLRIAPGLRAGPRAPLDRWREIEHKVAPTWPSWGMAPALVVADTVQLLALTAGPLLAPVPGAAALLAWSAQPAGVLGRRHLDGSALRLARRWRSNVRTAITGSRELRDAAAQRAAAPAPARPPESELFEERRTTCPWCGSAALVGRLDTTDLLQYKPGSFHLDECADCGHVFQNPALSITGLDYYYDQFYDGSSGELAESAFASMTATYERRMDAVARFTEPRTWLDVGAGHGHFCLQARQRWPEARFDGLDLSESIEEAARRGRVDTAYRGLFPDLAGGLPRSYDVVSMHHYLEHTREPRDELAAAAKVLEPQGLLMIEVPDPESPWARRLGRYWSCWFQPQHQHMVPCGNLVAALDETGFDVLSVERGPATMGSDVFLALLGAMGSWAPSPHYPWSHRPTPVDRLKRLAGFVTILSPVGGVAFAVDVVKDALARRPGNTAPGNAYRVVARRR